MAGGKGQCGKAVTALGSRNDGYKSGFTYIRIKGTMYVKTSVIVDNSSKVPDPYTVHMQGVWRTRRL